MINTYDFDGEYLTWTTDGYAGTVFYRNGKFSATTRCGVLHIKDGNIINAKYLSYIIRIIFPKFVNKSISNYKLTSNIVENIKIPVPSLSIQNKIVNILDQLETYSKDITTGLPLEINLRKKQYEYYRNLLLDFDKNAVTKHEI